MADRPLSTPTRRHPLRQLAITFAVLAVALFVLSGATKDATHGLGLVVGDIGWFGFLLSLLGLVLVAVAGVVVTARRRLARP
ncbi:MAG: hypothetical protein ACTHOD_02345 [Motilibacteraceae bacterium]